MKINKVQEQILISGKLGDGNYKKNGSNYCYRENHSKRELDYLKWKYNILRGLTTKGGITHEKPKGFSKDGVYTFSTITNKIFNKYAKMSIEECIKNLDELGLILYILDDGWVSCGMYERNWHFMTSGGSLTVEQLGLICRQFEKYNIKDVHIVGKVRYDLSIPKANNQLLFSYLKQHLPLDLDVVQKKFKYALL